MNSRLTGIFIGISTVMMSAVLTMPFHAEADGAEPATPVKLQTLTDEERSNLERLGEKSLEDQIEAVQKKVPLELIETGRHGGGRYFDSLGAPKRKIEEITDIEGLYGKAVCGKEPRILIADDAPPSTLLHEYIHFLQMNDDKRWCSLDGRILDSGEKKERAILYHRFEYETLKTLWDMRGKMRFNFEDNLILVEGLKRESDVFKSLGIKTLSEDESSQIANTLDDIHSKIQTLTWVTKSHDDAGSVMQKMEVVNVKSCVEQTKGTDESIKINDCLAKRCQWGGVSCQKVDKEELKKVGDELFSRIIYSWTKPALNEDCTIAKFHDELIDNIEGATKCWKEWYVERSKKEKDIKLLPTSPLKEIKGEVPKLGVDRQIAYYRPANPESFINAAYCYFIYQKVARFETLPIDQFAYATIGASIPLKGRKEYQKWLDESPQGKSCAALVRVFTGDEPSDWSEFGKSKNYALIINPIASLSGGLNDIEKTLVSDINHERLHIIYSEDKKIRVRVKAEWEKLTDVQRQKFKNDHTSYDFQDPEILYKEYFSYTRQTHPQKLF